MVACPKCVINNTLDSAFCKKCGAVLPISMIEEEQEKLKEIVTKGMESYQTGNLDEAMAIADHSILTNPSYGEAYALKGLIHERNRAYAEALDAYETVVALNPDSTIDKIKLNQLRNAFAQRQAGEPRADRKSAALISLGVATFILSIGAISYGLVQTSKETKQTASTNSPVQQSSNLIATRDNTAPPGITVNPNQRNPAPNGEVGALGSDNNPPIDSGVRNTTNRDRGSRTNFGSTEPFIVEPPTGPINPKPDSKLPNPIETGKKGNDRVKPPIDPQVTPGGDDKDPPVSSGGTIDISISKHGSDTPTSNQNSSSGKAFQRQGQTHQRNGKSAQAREAYQKAIDAFQKEIDSGNGDKDAATAGLNSSKQALKNLKD
jgi:tetratricopeptide (TPR) repeat protein